MIGYCAAVLSGVLLAASWYAAAMHPVWAAVAIAAGAMLMFTLSLCVMAGRSEG